MKLPLEDLNSDFCPPHPISIYIYRVTTAPKVHSNQMILIYIYIYIKYFNPIIITIKTHGKRDLDGVLALWILSM